MRFATITLLFLIAAAPATQPEIRRGLPVSSTNPEDRARMGFARIIQRIEPSMKGDPARLDSYLAAFRKEFVEDPRLFAASFRGDVRSDGTITLAGYAEYIEHHQALLRFLGQLGFDRIDDQITMLPDASLGDRLVGFISPDRAFVYDRTSSPRETVTECLRDEPIFLLQKTSDRNYLVHCADGYVGYISSDAVKTVDPAEFGARLSRFEKPQTREIIDRVIDHAVKQIGVKYVWGGRSDDGLDCSGLVQTSFKSQGINLPRDADQQAGMGKMVATRACRAGLRRGDLMFFLSRTGTVRHVAIYLGEQKFIQAADEGVHISSFDPKDPAYDAKHDRGFCFAKRVIE